MLKFFKRMERTRNFILIVFAVLLVVSLIVFGALQGNVQENLVYSTETVASVGSKSISLGELATLQQNSRQRQQNLPAGILLERMIRQKVLETEAERLGLAASDKEVAKAIREIFRSPEGQPFDQANYEQTAMRQAGSVEAFEESVRESLGAEKLQVYITSGVRVSDAEVLENFRRRNTKFDLSYVQISPAEIAKKLSPTDDELKQYFEKNKKNYYVSFPQKKISYIFLETAKVGERLKISDKEFRAEYDKLSDEAKMAGVSVQEIVFRVAKPEFDATVLEKANGIVETLRKDGSVVSEERFAETAKGQSENPVTAPNGGQVTGLVRRNPGNADDPYQRILDLKEGEITAPVKYGTNYYVLRRGKTSLKSFEDTKKVLDVSIRNRKAYAANAELAQKVAERLKKEKDVRKVAAEFSTQANMAVSEMLKETGYVKPGDEIQGLGVSQDFEQGIAKLEKPNDVGEKIPVPNGFAVPLLVDRKEPRDATFDEVKQKVTDAYKVEKARADIEGIAKRIAEKSGTAGGLAGAASAEGLKALEEDGFILGSPLGEGPSATTSKTLEDAVNDLKKDGVSKPLNAGENWYVIGVRDRTEASSQEFADQRDQLVQQMLVEKKGRVFADYLAAAQNRMEKNGEIIVYKEALAKLEEQNRQEQPSGLPQGFPNFPRQQVPVPPSSDGS